MLELVLFSVRMALAVDVWISSFLCGSGAVTLALFFFLSASSVGLGGSHGGCVYLCSNLIFFDEL